MHGAFEVDGVHTEVLVTDYGTRVLVLVTQIGKLGTMFLARGTSAGPAGASAGLDPPDVRVLVGRHDDEMLEAAARRIARVLKGRGIDKEVLVSLGLRAERARGGLSARLSAVRIGIRPRGARRVTFSAASFGSRVDID